MKSHTAVTYRLMATLEQGGTTKMSCQGHQCDQLLCSSVLYWDAESLFAFYSTISPLVCANDLLMTLVVHSTVKPV